MKHNIIYVNVYITRKEILTKYIKYLQKLSSTLKARHEGHNNDSHVVALSLFGLCFQECISPRCGM